MWKQRIYVFRPYGHKAGEFISIINQIIQNNYNNMACKQTAAEALQVILASISDDDLLKTMTLISMPAWRTQVMTVMSEEVRNK